MPTLMGMRFAESFIFKSRDIGVTVKPVFFRVDKSSHPQHRHK